MIFVTVGTHEQPFNRLLEEVERLVKTGVITEEVMVQTGYSDYVPKFCTCKDFLPYDEIVSFISNARIIITHGGPASFILPLQMGKIPIVVPRYKKFDEHINDHQVDFVKALVSRSLSIIPVIEISELSNVLINFEKISASIRLNNTENNTNFNIKFSALVDEVMACKRH